MKPWVAGWNRLAPSRRRLASAAGIAVLLAAALLARPGCRSDRTMHEALLAEVQQGPLVITVQGTGDIRARDSAKIIPAIKRGAELTFLVPEGKRVVKDEVVARLNTDEIERRLKDLRAALDDSQSKLDGAATDLEIQQMDNASGLTKAEQGVESTRLELEKYRRGDEPMDLRNAVLKVQTAASDLIRHQKRYADLKALLTEGFVTEDEVEEERIAVETAQVAMETAGSESNLLHAYSIPLKRANFEGALAQANTELEKTRKQNEARLRNKQQVVEMARNTVERGKADLSLVLKEQEASEVHAPADGIVMYGDPDAAWRRGDIQVGSTFQPGQVLMTVPDVSRMEAVINIPEADIHNVRTGQEAIITVEAFMNSTFTGEVSKVAEVANSEGWWSPDVKEFKINIRIDHGEGLKPGFSCRAEIVTETIPATMYLPVQAVHRENKRYYVYTAAAGGPRRTEVRIGPASTKYVAILDGVDAGTRVLLTAPLLSDKAKKRGS